MRNPLIFGLLAVVCAENAPPVDPPMQAEPAAPVAVDPIDAGATETEASPEPEPEPVDAVLVEGGWVLEAEDSDAAMLRITSMRGATNTEMSAAFFAKLGAVLECYETRRDEGIPQVSMGIHYRAPRDPSELPVRVDGHEDSQEIRRCVRDSLLEDIPDVTDALSYELRLYPQRGAAPSLRKPRPEDETMVAEGGTCWVREHYPCAPHKHCKASQWVRAACVERSLSEDPTDD